MSKEQFNFAEMQEEEKGSSAENALSWREAFGAFIRNDASTVWNGVKSDIAVLTRSKNVESTADVALKYALAGAWSGMTDEYES